MTLIETRYLTLALEERRRNFRSFDLQFLLNKAASRQIHWRLTDCLCAFAFLNSCGDIASLKPTNVRQN